MHVQGNVSADTEKDNLIVVYTIVVALQTLPKIYSFCLQYVRYTVVPAKAKLSLAWKILLAEEEASGSISLPLKAKHMWIENAAQWSYFVGHTNKPSYLDPDQDCASQGLQTEAIIVFEV